MISDDLKWELAGALNAKHPCDDDNTCDIGKAMELGLVLWAGDLLESSTDCPKVERLMRKAREDPDFDQELENERLQLLEEPHVTCEECGSVVWTDSNTVCDNCHAEVIVDRCTECGLSKDDHADGKCLFEPTDYQEA